MVKMEHYCLSSALIFMVEVALDSHRLDLAANSCSTLPELADCAQVLKLHRKPILAMHLHSLLRTSLQHSYKGLAPYTRSCPSFSLPRMRTCMRRCPRRPRRPTRCTSPPSTCMRRPLRRGLQLRPRGSCLHLAAAAAWLSGMQAPCACSEVCACRCAYCPVLQHWLCSCESGFGLNPYPEAPHSTPRLLLSPGTH